MELRAAGPRAAGRRELQDHARAMLDEALLQPGEAFGIGARPAVVIANMAVDDRSAASNAACVLSTCSAIEMGTAGLSLCWGSERVMATQMMQGVIARNCACFRLSALGAPAYPSRDCGVASED